MADEGRKAPPRNRTLTVGAVSATVAASYVGGALRRLFLPAAERPAHRAATHRRNAERILDVAGRMKGGVMKAMQLLSYQNEVLPAEYVDILSGLQDQAPPMSADEARAQVVAELGAAPEALFASFDAEPAAAASLGQVHHATLAGGRRVAVKIQYPGIADEVAADLKLLRRSLTAQKIAGADLLRQPGLDQRHLYEDVAARLGEELDYRREALHLQVFGEMYRRRPEILVPAAVAERSSARVLTMTWIDGYPIRDVMNEGADYALRERTVRLLDWMCLHEVIGVGVTHADPHPGNYLVTADGLGLLDLGCVKVIDDARLGQYRDQITALLRNDRDLLVHTLEAVGQIAPGEDPSAAIAFTEFLYMPILRDEPWDGRNLDFPAELSKRFTALVRARNLNFPTETAFLMRKFIGLAAVFRGLRVFTHNFHRSYRDYLEQELPAADALRRRMLVLLSRGASDTCSRPDSSPGTSDGSPPPPRTRRRGRSR